MRNTKNRQLLKIAEPYLWLLPSFILFIGFTFYPFIETLIKSFFIVDTFGSVKRFVGFENYAYIFQDKQFIKSIYNTLLFVIITVPVANVMGLSFALLANKKRKFSSVYEAGFLITIAIAPAVGGVIFQLIFNPTFGVLNSVLGTEIRWLSDSKYALISIGIIKIWLSSGYAFLFMLAAVRGVPAELLESADMDGASTFRKIRNIYLPMTSPTLFYLICTSVVFNMLFVDLVIILTQGGPQNSTYTIMYFVFTQFAGSGNYTTANPAAIITFSLTFVIMLSLFIWERKGVHYQ